MNQQSSLGTSWPFHLLLMAAVCSSATATQPQPEASDVIIDGVKIPFGLDIEVVGDRVGSDPFQLDFSDAVAALRGLRVNGRATQEDVQFHLVPAARTPEAKQIINSLDVGNYCKVRGNITEVQTTGSKKTCLLVVDHFEGTPAAPLTMADFVDRTATLEGTAAAGGKLAREGETAQLEGLTAWPQGVEGKRVSVRGTVRGGKGRWQFAQPTWSLVDLADMVGQQVSLEGSLWSLNGEWWFNYRDERIYLTSESGPVMTFDDDHGRTACVAGRLVRQLRPALDQISLKDDRDLVPTYVVRGSKVNVRDSLTHHERFGPAFLKKNTARDGVPELIAGSLRRNLLGNETTTLLYAERNYDAIAAIVKESTAASRDILAQRMIDKKLEEPLRLLYATILTRLNDERGRAFLLSAVNSDREETRKDSLYCLGAFPYLATENEGEAVDCAWAEKTLIAIMSERNKAKAAVRYSSIPSLLLKINSPTARQTLLEYALDQPGEPDTSYEPSNVTRLLCEPEAKLAAEDLLRLEAVSKDKNTRRSILGALLQLKHPAAADRFLKDLEESFVYMDMREHGSPEVLAALKPHIKGLAGDAKSHTQMLLILGERDPVPGVIALLDDHNFTDKNLAMFELARLGDARAAAPVALVLREAPRTYFNTDSELTASMGVRHALDAIARANNRDAVRCLIDLLSVDLARFGGYIDREGNRRILAAHLIGITGESFGVDQGAWREWEKAQPEGRFQRAIAPKGDHFREDSGGRIDLGS